MRNESAAWPRPIAMEFEVPFQHQICSSSRHFLSTMIDAEMKIYKKELKNVFSDY
jgi:hypothetical protein